MSEYLQVQCEYKDEKLLREAVEAVARARGIRPEIHEQGKEPQLVGWHGDLRQETAQFVIRRGMLDSASNDMGWSRQADGTYRLVISKFDNSSDQRRARQIAGAVDVEYKRRLVERQVRKSVKFRGARVKATRTCTGAVQMQIVMRG